MSLLKNKIFTVAISNIKKMKGQSISFIILILITAALMNLGVTTYRDCSRNFDRKCEEFNAEDGVLFVQNTGYKQEMLDYVKNNDDINNYEKNNIILVDTTYEYGNGDMSKTTIFTNMSEDVSMGKWKIVDEANYDIDNGIYAPYIFNISGGYDIGDTITFKISGKDYEFTIKGFFEDIYFSSINLAVIGFKMEESVFTKLSNDLKGANDATMIKFQMYDKSKVRKFMTDYFSKSSQLAGKAMTSRAYYDITKSSRNLTSNIAGTIIVAFAIVILIVSLIIVRFRIVNSIEEDMQNIGAMKATGFTSRQIILTYLVQFMIITFTGIILGIILSAIVLPALGIAFTAQSGMIWNSGIEIVSVIITVMSIVIMVGVTVYFSAVKIRELKPIVALRSGINTHNFKKNYFPLKKVKFNISIALALKSIMQNIKQNIMIVIIIIATTYATGFAAVLFYNITVNPEIFTRAVVGEMSDVSLYMDRNNIDTELINELREDEDVDNAIYWTDGRAVSKNIGVYFYVTDDFSMATSKMCYEGRSPKHDNEIAIGGLMAEELGKKVGDTIVCSYGNNTYEYIITGLIQTSNNMGCDAQILTEGYKHIDPKFENYQINIYLKNNVNIDDFVEKIQLKYGDRIKDVYNVKKIVDSMMGVYSNIVSILGIVIFIITILIICLILLLIISTYILRNKVDIGIKKAIGYTSKDIRQQIVLAFMPVVVIASIVGSIVSKLFTNSLVGKLFKSLGIMKFDFNIPLVLLFILSFSICFVSYLITVRVSAKVNKIASVTLIKE